MRAVGVVPPFAFRIDSVKPAKSEATMDNDAAPKIRPSLGASAKRFTDFTSFPDPARSRIQEAFDRAKASLEEDFTGIAAGGVPAKGLFPITNTGVSVQPVVDAANAFRASLTNDQWRDVTFDIDDGAWRAWHNMHIFLMRHGLLLDELNAGQKRAALGLIEASSSAAGYESARDIMKLNEHAREITGSSEEFGEWYYWISVFGEPSLSEPWGWQIDGHHLIVNCFVYGDQMVMTPDFRGSEPVAALSGKYAGTKVFHEEESGGLAFMKALTPEQRQQAVIGTALPRDVITTAQADNLKLDYAGISCGALTTPQQERLVALIETYVGRIRPGHAEVRMDDVTNHLAETHFGWIGDHGEKSPFYYRIHSPVILIEFDHLPGIIWDNLEPTRDHIHTIVRTPNGNDYGRDLLRQHYEMHDHSHPHTHHRRGLS
jgi:hypothetical protein